MGDSIEETKTREEISCTNPGQRPFQQRILSQYANRKEQTMPAYRRPGDRNLSSPTKLRLFRRKSQQ